ncbi:MAG: type II toxin-antitoxin system HicB family antitoxin [Tepidisphaeraceae bacterium]
MGAVPARGPVKVYHVQLQHDQGWYVGRILERAGVTTQGRTLDELVYMVRDAIALMWGEKNVHLELIVSPEITGLPKGRKRPARRAVPR